MLASPLSAVPLRHDCASIVEAPFVLHTRSGSRAMPLLVEPCHESSTLDRGNGWNLGCVHIRPNKRQLERLEGEGCGHCSKGSKKHDVWVHLDDKGEISVEEGQPVYSRDVALWFVIVRLLMGTPRLDFEGEAAF